MRFGINLPLELQLRPSKLLSSPDIPLPLLEGQLCLQDDHVLCPANGHGLGQHLGDAPVGTVEFPHPAQISGREASGIRICAAQIFRCSHRRALFRPAADQPTNLTVQLHLRQICRNQLVQRREHGTVVCGFSDVHRILPPFRRGCALFCPLLMHIAKSQALGGHPKGLTLGNILLLPTFQLHHPLPLDDEAVIDHPVHVVMPQEPVIEPALLIHCFQEIRQPVGNVVPV